MQRPTDNPDRDALSAALGRESTGEKRLGDMYAALLKTVRDPDAAGVIVAHKMPQGSDQGGSIMMGSGLAVYSASGPSGATATLHGFTESHGAAGPAGSITAASPMVALTIGPHGGTVSQPRGDAQRLMEARL